MMKMMVVMTIWSVEYEKSELQPIHLFWTLSLCEPCEHQLIKSLGGLLLFVVSEHLVVDRVLGPRPKILKKKQGSFIVASQLTMSDHLFWTSC